MFWPDINEFHRAMNIRREKWNAQVYTMNNATRNVCQVRDLLLVMIDRMLLITKLYGHLWPSRQLHVQSLSGWGGGG